MVDLDEGERMASVLLADPWRPIVQSDNSIALINFSRDCTEAQARAFIDAMRVTVNNAPALIAELRAARERIATLEGLLQAHGIEEGP